MKVELDNIRLGHSPLTDKVFAGILAPSKNEKQRLWKHKIDVTNDFIYSVINRWENQTEIISAWHAIYDQAIDDFAQQQSIAFANFIAQHNYKPHDIDAWDEGRKEHS